MNCILNSSCLTGLAFQSGAVFTKCYKHKEVGPSCRKSVSGDGLWLLSCPSLSLLLLGSHKVNSKRSVSIENCLTIDSEKSQVSTD